MTTSMHPGNTTRAFALVRQETISHLNQFLPTAQKHLLGYGLHNYISQKTGNFEIDGLFKDQGLTVMFKASCLASIDNVSAFSGEIVDWCCGEVSEAAIT